MANLSPHRKAPAVRTLKEELDRYVLQSQLAVETEAWYRRVVSVYCNWEGRDPPAADFTGERISKLLVAKLAAGRSTHYVKSLRGGLRALLGVIRGESPVERVRGVKCQPLDPAGWTTAEVEQLLAAGLAGMPDGSRNRWRLCIELAYYTGLDRCDIERLEQTHFADNGALLFRRSKTGKLVGGGIPLELLARIRADCPRKGPICRMGVTPEWFRKVFARIVARAGLFGTFKRLRKTSGSLVDAAKPGSGHRHLGNSQAIFERHYEVRRLTVTEPTMPPPLRPAG
jgi:integrase